MPRAREIARAHAAFLAGRRTTTGSAAFREVVARSWLRAARARVDPDGAAPVLLSDDELAAYRAGHPLSAVIGVLRELVAGTADDGEHLTAASDEAGRLLWVEGHRDARRRAEAMNFVEGAAWDEPHAGTNAGSGCDDTALIVTAIEGRGPVVRGGTGPLARFGSGLRA